MVAVVLCGVFSVTINLRRRVPAHFHFLLHYMPSSLCVVLWVVLFSCVFIHNGPMIMLKQGCMCAV